MNCNTTHYRANSSSVPGDPTLDAHVSDADIRRIAVELVRGGGVAGLHVPHVADDAFDHFVVDRMQQGQRIYLRPKVPFG